MFGTDNCRASVAYPGTSLGIAGGLAQGTAYPTPHLAPAGVENFHYTLFKMASRILAHPCQHLELKALPEPLSL